MLRCQRGDLLAPDEEERIDVDKQRADFLFDAAANAVSIS